MALLLPRFWELPGVTPRKRCYCQECRECQDLFGDWGGSSAPPPQNAAIAKILGAASSAQM
eukprot:10051353-Alexandrium_andersonii.AAC.1